MMDYLLAYDVSDECVRERVCRLLKNHSISHQKSAYECSLTISQKSRLTSDTKQMIDDDFCVFVIKNHHWRHQPKPNTIVIGDEWLYVG
ncbi:MAG: CRISPR-associated endonuclease Cas2 [Moraxella sp.]|nr:CRISPR-associated endonuclease Cas2 [Moraxella sp.]